MSINGGSIAGKPSDFDGPTGQHHNAGGTGGGTPKQDEEVHAGGTGQELDRRRGGPLGSSKDVDFSGISRG